MSEDAEGNVARNRMGRVGDSYNQTRPALASTLRVSWPEIGRSGARFPDFKTLAALFSIPTDSVGLRGVCLAGRVMQEARIVGNSITGFRQGIHNRSDPSRDFERRA